MPVSTYREAVDYLYTQLPMFQRVGAVAFKKDLTNTLALCQALGNPQNKFKSVHVAGTNGKGSTSHMLAAVLQCAGCKTGLYTSPHLKEFTERIRVNGAEVPAAFVVDFVNRLQPTIEAVKPSFFELTVAMAFDYFARQQVDVAVIEVGLGGRLDSTNVITPVVSVITNIGWDHMDLLGDTLPLIAAEKAGIIKAGVPVVVSERQPEVMPVFAEKSSSTRSPLYVASDRYRAQLSERHLRVTRDDKELLEVRDFPLPGAYQERNVAAVVQTVEVLNDLDWRISTDAVQAGLQNVVRLTHLKGRWQQLQAKPLIFCDTGHNVDGIREVVRMIRRQRFEHLWMVIGVVKDKALHEVLPLLPREAYYYFCQANLPRAMDADLLRQEAVRFGLAGETVRDVNQALRTAKARARESDLIFVGGSTFVVAEIKGL
jgi:dihydrofolate synthase/folylpolyglutamate synthase